VTNGSNLRFLEIDKTTFFELDSGDPDYACFARDPSGTIKLMLRIWLAGPKGDLPYLHAYLGTITFCFIGPSHKDIFRLFRFTSKAATEAKQSPKVLRHDLTVLLRKHIHEEYGS